MTAMTTSTSTAVRRANQAGRSSRHCAVPMDSCGIHPVG